MSIPTQDQQKGVVAEVAENLGGFFRHFLPGALIVGAAMIARPSWFTFVDFDSWPILTVVAATAMTIGNAWFALNRYGIHQIVDYLCYIARSEGPAKKRHAAYLDDLALYVREALIETDVPPRARQHVTFRASSVLLIYTIAELVFLVAIWSERSAITYNYKVPLCISAIIIFALGVWQNVITRRIDAALLHKGLVPRHPRDDSAA